MSTPTYDPTVAYPIQLPASRVAWLARELGAQRVIVIETAYDGREGAVYVPGAQMPKALQVAQPILGYEGRGRQQRNRISGWIWGQITKSFKQMPKGSIAVALGLLLALAAPLIVTYGPALGFVGIGFGLGTLSSVALPAILLVLLAIAYFLV